MDNLRRSFSPSRARIALGLGFLLASGCIARSVPITLAPSVVQLNSAFGSCAPGTTYWVAEHARRPVAIVWFDQSAAMGPPATAYGTASGQISLHDASSPIDIQVDNTDPSKGSATINGIKYDLANGGIFLVSTKGGQKVTQLKRDMSKIWADDLGLKSLADSDSDIGAFILKARETANASTSPVAQCADSRPLRFGTYTPAALRQ
jgi:hypothetical protein